MRSLDLVWRGYVSLIAGLYIGEKIQIMADNDSSWITWTTAAIFWLITLIITVVRENKDLKKEEIPLSNFR